MKKIYKLILIIVCVSGMTLATYGVVSAYETRESQPPADVVISTVAEWETFADRCRADDYSKGKVFALACDIDFQGKETVTVPIFLGEFRGEGYGLRNVNFSDQGSNIGMFRIVDTGAQVRDLTVTGTAQPAGTKTAIALIAGQNRGLLSLCKTSGKVDAASEAGGIAGINEASGVIETCQNAAEITGQTNVGGICGKNAGKITGCTNTGRIDTDDSLSGQSAIGGICGSSSASVLSCENTGDVGIRYKGTQIGGIAGYVSDIASGNSITDCRNGGKIQGASEVGGILGACIAAASRNFVISDCINTGRIGASATVGGIAGRVAATTGSQITCSALVNEGQVTAKGNQAGGIVGVTNINQTAGIDISVAADRIRIDSVLNAGRVEGKRYVGGITGGSDIGVITAAIATGELKAASDVGGITSRCQNVSSSYSLVTIDCAGENVGAIAGSLSDTDVYANNFFAKESGLFGINGVDYAEKVAPLAVEQMFSGDEISQRLESPDTSESDRLWEIGNKTGFPKLKKLSRSTADHCKNALKERQEAQTALTFTVYFIADDETVGTVKIPYRGNLREEDMPKVPRKENQFGAWEYASLDQVVYHTHIKAVYTDALKSLSTGGVRPELIVEKYAHPDTVLFADENKFDYALPIENHRVVKAYTVATSLHGVEETGTVTVRVLLPTKIKNPKIALYRGEVAIVNGSVDDSYFVFEMNLGETFALLEEGFTIADIWWLWVVIAGILLAGAIIFLTVYLKEKKSAAKANKEKGERSVPEGGSERGAKSFSEEENDSDAQDASESIPAAKTCDLKGGNTLSCGNDNNLREGSDNRLTAQSNASRSDSPKK